MCEELAKLFEPEMKEATRIAETVGRTEGRAEGECLGEIKGKIELIRRKYEKGYDAEQTADMLEQKVDFIKDIYQLLQEHTEYSDGEIAAIYIEKNGEDR